jgi:hypothetical protein
MDKKAFDADRIIRELIALHDARKPAGGVYGQIVGLEPYVLRASGNQFAVLQEAAELIHALTSGRPAVPAGSALVPLDPNDAQQKAGAEAVRIDTTLLNKLFTANRVYRAMIAAARDVPSHDGMTPEQYWAACRAEGAIKRNDDAEKD